MLKNYSCNDEVDGRYLFSYILELTHMLLFLIHRKKGDE